MSERVPPALDGLVSAARRDGPLPSTLARIADGAATRSQSASSLGGRGLMEKGARSVLAVAVAAVAVVAALALSGFALRDGDDARRVVVPVDVGAPPSTANVRPREPATSPRSEPAPTRDVPTMDVRSLPSPKTSVERRSGPEVAVKAPPSSSEEPSEAALLHRAHAAISSEPAQALALTAEHARRFPGGMLVQEREVIAIEALARVGRMDEARTRADAFSARHPSSAYRRRVDEALGETR